jgi:spore germination cell wall hydrolase CwlJ-like protein
MVALSECTRLGQALPLGLAAFFFIGGSTRIAHQDIAALMASQPALSERWREHLAASPFGAMHVAAFNFPRPLGTLVPEPESVRLARFDANPNATKVNRGGKGDLLIPRLQIEISAELLREDMAAATGQAEDVEDLQAALRFKPFPEYDVSMSLEAHPQVPSAAAIASAETGADENAGTEAEEANVIGATRLYFDAAPLNASLAAVEPWGSGEAPIVMLPAPEIALAEAPAAAPAAPVPSDTPAPAQPNITVAAKGEPAGGIPRRSPAQMLRLEGKSLAKAEKCLANAVYFEARSEPVRGQVAVAQVVLNRAFSGYYPNDVCGVVYQNANRHLSCQFTFACDGIPDVATEHEQWERATRIAKATLDGRIWLEDVGKATHYHASYVYPYWVRSMRKHKKIGLHTFYRPRKWGDGADAPAWGTGPSADLVAKL